MTIGRKGLILLVLAGLFVLVVGTAALADGGLPGMSTANRATGGGLDGAGISGMAGIGTLGNPTITPPTRPLLDLPALHVECDAAGRPVMHLPAIHNLVGKPSKACGAPVAVAPPPGPAKKLPKTGANVGDLFAAGMAALSSGGIMARRLKLSLVR